MEKYQKKIMSISSCDPLIKHVWPALQEPLADLILHRFLHVGPFCFADLLLHRDEGLLELVLVHGLGHTPGLLHSRGLRLCRVLRSCAARRRRLERKTPLFHSRQDGTGNLWLRSLRSNTCTMVVMDFYMKSFTTESNTRNTYVQRKLKGLKDWFVWIEYTSVLSHLRIIKWNN